jgi:ribosome-associated translation inhibitor RaiA
MPLKTILELGDVALTEVEERRIRRKLETLGRRLTHHPEPIAEVVLDAHPARQQVEAKVRVRLGPLGGHLVSLQAAGTADRAVRLAIGDLERQLDRRLAGQRGEPTYGVPSRRLPKQLRPSCASSAESGEPNA